MEQNLSNNLEPGEYIVWADQPLCEVCEDPVRMVLFIVIPLFLLASFIISGEYLFGEIIGLIVFVVVAISMFYDNYRKARQTIYALTNQRVIILKGLRSPVIRSYPLEELQISYWKERKKDSTGELIFETTDGKTEFMKIQNVKKVVNHIKLLLGNLKSDGHGIER